MKWTRRDALRIAGLAGTGPLINSACGQARPEPRLLASFAHLPEAFAIDLPIPPVLKPVRSDASSDYFELTAQPATAHMLPGLSTEIWGYGGIFPGPTIEVRAGRAASVRVRNRLPVPIVNHLHGGKVPSASDGYPTDFIMPVTGFTGMNMRASGARTALGEREYVYPNIQRATMLWYHDHRMDFTGAQVWRGLAGLYILRDTEEDSLPIPRGDKEIPLVICDRSFAADGTLLYPSLDPTLMQRGGVRHDFMGGVLGDVILVNGAPWPKCSVANTRYRLRILNASNARRYELALSPAPQGPAFVQIGSDGGLLEAPVNLRSVRIAPAERFDLIVDFSGYPLGSTVTLVNRAGSGATANIMRFDIVRSESDRTTIPARLSAGVAIDPREATVTRDFDFSYKRGSQTWTINGKPFDEARVDAAPKLDSTEIWRLRTDFNHPLHLHLVQFRILSHGGRPGQWDAGWKDTIDLEPGQAASILMRFSGYRGRYVFHCHNLEHEDMAMMGNFEVV